MADKGAGVDLMNATALGAPDADVGDLAFDPELGVAMHRQARDDLGAEPNKGPGTSAAGVGASNRPLSYGVNVPEPKAGLGNKGDSDEEKGNHAETGSPAGETIRQNPAPASPAVNSMRTRIPF